MNPQSKSQPLTIQFGRELDLFLAKLVTKGILLAAVVAIIKGVGVIFLCARKRTEGLKCNPSLPFNCYKNVFAAEQKRGRSDFSLINLTPFPEVPNRNMERNRGSRR
jgi:hypothetical protein